MVLRVALVGSGQRGDPYRAAIPTHQLLHGNVTEGWALVSIPDDVHGLAAADLAHEAQQETTEGTFYPALCADCVSKVHARWDERYPTHREDYRLELVPPA